MKSTVSRALEPVLPSAIKNKEFFIQLPIKLEEDYNAGIFKDYTSYTTSIGVTLNSVKEAIPFNLYHEGIHLGIILQLLKFI